MGTYLRQLTGEEVQWCSENMVAIGSAGGPEEKGLVFIQNGKFVPNIGII